MPRLAHVDFDISATHIVGPLHDLYEHALPCYEDAVRLLISELTITESGTLLLSWPINTVVLACSLQEQQALLRHSNTVAIQLDAPYRIEGQLLGGWVDAKLQGERCTTPTPPLAVWFCPLEDYLSFTWHLLQALVDDSAKAGLDLRVLLAWLSAHGAGKPSQAV